MALRYALFRVGTSLARIAARHGKQQMRRRADEQVPAIEPGRPTRPGGGSSGDSAAGSRYPGDFTGTVTLEYAPHPDGRADPGEIVWTWVPFEEDHGQGKDRPVLIIGHDGDRLLGLMLTSKDHDRDAADEARHGRHWMDIGAGAWDRQHRPSEVRLDRVLRVDPDAVRREGAQLDRARFDEVAEHVRQLHGWPAPPRRP